MKKLMIMATVALMAIASQAALCAWKYTYKTAVDGLDGSMGYVFLGSYDSTPTFQASDFTSLTGIATTTKTKPAFVNQILDQTVEGVTAANPNFYLVLVNADKSGYWVSAVQDATDNMYESGSSAKGTLTITPASISFTKFSTGDVPEPTSAMLLLLGVAGLALRRKQA